MPKLTELGRHIFPLTRPDDDRDRPVVNGTAILFSVDTQKYVATAAHVLDGDNTIYMPDGVVLEVERGRVVQTALPTSGNRADDKVDLAVFQLTEPQFTGLVSKGIAPIPFSSWAVNDRSASGKRYVFTGFPDSRTRHVYARRVVAPGGVSANCLCVEAPELTAKDFHPTSHIGARYDRERMAFADGTRVNGPDCYGMSGGAVWTLCPGTDDYEWVGIGIRYFEREHLLVGTRLGALAALLRSSFPETLPYVPTSPYFAISDA